MKSGPGGWRPSRTAAGGLSDETPASRPEGPDGLALRAQAGDGAAREELLRRYSPFALKAASEATGTYVRLGRDDEASVAMMALNEAMDSYDPERGAGFLGFARAVIRRRLIDHLRRTRIRSREVPVNLMGEEGRVVGSNSVAPADSLPTAARAAAAQVAAAEGDYRAREERWDRLEEILRYRELLAGYGISLAELVRISPRHEDARRRAMEAARVLAGRADLMGRLRLRGELPLRELAPLVAISRKTLERQRKYIIAVVLIMVEDLPYLEAYLK